MQTHILSTKSSTPHVPTLQVRQHVFHKRSFLYLEQLILKHGAADQVGTWADWAAVCNLPNLGKGAALKVGRQGSTWAGKQQVHAEVGR